MLVIVPGAGFCKNDNNNITIGLLHLWAPCLLCSACLLNIEFKINTASVLHDSNKYLKLLALNGTMVLVGLPESPISIGPFSLTSARRSLAGSSVGGIRETQEMLDFCSNHNTTCDMELIPIQKVNEGL